MKTPKLLQGSINSTICLSLHHRTLLVIPVVVPLGGVVVRVLLHVYVFKPFVLLHFYVRISFANGCDW